MISTVTTFNMGRRCSFGGCDSGKNGNGSIINFFKFPSSVEQSLKWSKIVKSTRTDWKGPKPYSLVCSNHFDDNAFEGGRLGLNLAAQFGLSRRAKLKVNALPMLARSEVGDVYATQTTRGSQEGILEETGIQTHNSNADLETSTGGEQTAVCGRNNKDDKVTVDAACQTCTITTDAFIQTTPVQVIPQIQTRSVSCQTSKHVKSTSCQTKIKVTKSKGLQAHIKPESTEQSVQCKLVETEPQHTSSPVCSEIEDSDSESEEEISDYMPTFEDTVDDDDDEDDMESTAATNEMESPHLQRKFLVFEPNLLQLFNSCLMCHHETEGKVIKVKGSFIIIKQQCENCGFTREWASQPFIKDIPAGNILLSASILFAGCLPSKALQVFHHLRCLALTRRTFFHHQAKYLQPTIISLWQTKQAAAIDALTDFSPVVLGGDGRADSPGHSAKYGLYSMMELQTDQVIDIQLVQSNEVSGSYHMEKEGLKRSLEFLKSHDVDVGEIITDRHRQIGKFLREELPEAQHRYDVWHVAKGLKKKVIALSKERDCEKAGKWSRSIVNHMYWCATSTEDGDEDIIEAKWLSLVGHMQNRHTGHGDPFPECAHGHLRGRERRKKWLQPSTKVCKKLTMLVTNKTLCKDVRNLSPRYQTYSLESFHSLVNHFAPKMYSFSYHGLTSRLCLAAMHYNENTNRNQAQTQAGDPQFTVKFPKYKCGGHVLKKVMERSTYDYVLDLMTELAMVLEDDVSLPIMEDEPEPLCHQFERPDKTTLIREHRTRFAH
ncbi:uncharacterized protein [Ptychodera flava]|uniref:uncharacterized protein n=1 Tax=Ptychodera flava TaxID=63121 RepID=UPI00396A3464